MQRSKNRTKYKVNTISFINLDGDHSQKKTCNMSYYKNKFLLRLEVDKKSTTRRMKHDAHRNYFTERNFRGFAENRGNLQN